MPFEATSTKGSVINVSISGSGTEMPGLQSFTVSSGEESTFDGGDLASDYEILNPARVGGGGTISGTKLYDPLDATDGFLAGLKDIGGAPTDENYFEGSVEISDSGQSLPFKGILTKWELKAERKNGWIVDFEIKLHDRMLMV